MAPRKQSGAATDAAPEVDVRGQITLPLDGQDYLLRPSWEAIEEIERELRPISHLSADAFSFALQINEMAIIAAHLMHAHGATLTDKAPLAASYKGAKPEKLAKLIYEAGLPIVCARLAVVLHGAVNGGYTAAGEVRPAATTKEAIPAGE